MDPKSNEEIEPEEYDQMFKKSGCLKIFSEKLGRTIYLVRDIKAKRHLKKSPGDDVYLMNEIPKLRGLAEDDLMLMLEAKEVFKGVFIDPPIPEKELKRGGQWGKLIDKLPEPIPEPVKKIKPTPVQEDPEDMFI